MHDSATLARFSPAAWMRSAQKVHPRRRCALDEADSGIVGWAANDYEIVAAAAIARLVVQCLVVQCLVHEGIAIGGT
jgi:hypothetical protein